MTPKQTMESGPVLLFDEVCLLCNSFVQFVFRNEACACFRFASLQSTAGKALLVRNNLDTESLDSFYVVDGTDVYARSDAALYVAGRLVWPWSLTRALVVVPRPLRDCLYRLVAANRYVLFGKAKECALPPNNMAERIID